MAKVCKPFTLAKIKYFDARDVDNAWTWLQEGGYEYGVCRGRRFILLQKESLP